MLIEKKHEILESLPVYGPMYVPVTDNGEPFYSEGVPVRFYKTDQTEWVANFQPGWTDYSKVFDFPEHNIIIVIAGGTAYVMNPDDEKPKLIFGITISETVETANRSLIFADDIKIIVFDNSNGEFWETSPISWDGIRNLKISGDILFGESYRPTNSTEEWCSFSINLKTREVEGGTWNEFFQNNLHLEVGTNGMLSKKTKKKSWWKLWK